MPNPANAPKPKSRVDAVHEGLIELPPLEPRTGSTEPVTLAPPSNPYLSALVVLTILFAAISVLGWLIGSLNSGDGGNLDAEAIAFSIATGTLWIAFGLLVATLIAGAVTWQLKRPTD
jgi:hypothetical protein